MNLKGFISITGKPGLFKVVGQAKDRLIVESLTDGKRMPAFASQKISALEDITMYTTDDDVPLGEIIQKIYDKENGGACISANEESAKLHAYFAEVLPNYDKERVYNSDVKKLFSWYNMLQSSGTFTKIQEEEKKAAEKTAEAEAKVENADSAEEKPVKKVAKAGDKKPKVAGLTKVKAEAKAKSSVTRKINAPKRGA